MNQNNKNIIIALIVGIVLALGIGSMFVYKSETVSVGVAGNLLAENYLPFIRSNNGYNSAKAITTSDTITGGTITDGTFSITGGAMSGVSTLTGLTTLTVSGAVNVGAFTQGGSVLATSTSATATTLSVSDLLTYSTWEVTPNTADLTYTFPASSTLATLVPTAGNSRTWTIVNATTTATIDVIFAAGTGSAIKGSCGGGLTLDEDSHGTITLTRKANSDIVINTCFPTAD